MPALKRFWEKTFLEERPSVSLSVFRVALAAVVGLHVIPTLFQLDDNYLAGAFREYNASFFPIPVLTWVDAWPDWGVRLMAGIFLIGWLGFLTGLCTQASAIVMGMGCYFFYARNSLHIGTLSYDILLVTLSLAYASPYMGDSFSLDSVRRVDAQAFRRKRPFAIQRLLQLQIAFTYFYTGLCKVTGEGNWISQNPYLYLMNSPALGVIRDFPGRSLLAERPGLCYALGLACAACELSLPLWLFWRRTRLWAAGAAALFQVYLWATMHVPTIFLFLFPPQLALFIDPEAVVRWLDSRRRRWREKGRDVLLYDGDCSFCRAAVARVLALDPFGRVDARNFREEDLKRLDPRLTPKACETHIHLLEAGGKLSAGFFAFKRLSLRLPLMWPLAPLMHLPGAKAMGVPTYDWVARMRYRISFFVETGRWP